MSERDEDLLRRYRAMDREAPPGALDAAILAASRRSVRARGVPRWGAAVSVAAVLVLALGIVLKVQREAPETTLPAESRAAPSEVPAAIAPEPPAAIAPASPTTDTPHAMAQRAPKPKVEAKHAAPPQAAASRFQAAPEPSAAASAPPAPALAEKRAGSAAARDAAPRANIGAAPLSAQGAVAVDPLQRELERIARLREEGKNDEADTALAAFQREHPDFRIEPAMWDRVRRR